jgi:outer membrane protein
VTVARARRLRSWRFVVAAALLPVLLHGVRAADESPLRTFTLEEAMDFALANYPGMRAAQEQLAAARAGVGVAQTAYLPRADLLWQENRATDNNVTGLLLPQSVIPSISGPVKDTTTSASVWGSAAGALLSWEPFDFGARAANVDLARTATQQANARVDLTRLEVAASAADAFLTVLAADRVAHAAHANVDRLQVFATAVHALVANQLRPGADASRADAELAAARTQLIQAQQAAELARVSFAEALGIPDTAVGVDAGRLLEHQPARSPSDPNLEAHPLLVAEGAAVDGIRARERILERSYFPRVYLQGAFYGRGSGAASDGTLEGGTKGLQPDTANWASGVSVSFPLLDIFQILARRQVEAGNEAAEESRYAQTLQQLKAQQARARALVDGAQRIAANTPIQLKAAQAAERQARARYQAALATITEVAEAQHLLAQAQTDNAVAHLSVWRAWLVAAKVQGDLKPFLEQVTQARPTGEP